MKNKLLWKRTVSAVLASLLAITVSVSFPSCTTTVTGPVESGESTSSSGESRPDNSSANISSPNGSDVSGGNTTSSNNATSGNNPGGILRPQSTGSTSTTTSRPNTSSQSPGTPTPTFDPYENIPTDVKQIKILLWYTPDAAEQAVLDAFTEKFGIDVRVISTDNAGYLSRLSTLVASNDAPDVAGVYNFPVPITRGLFNTIDVATTDKGGAFDLERDPAYDLDAMELYSWKGAYYMVQLKGNWHADRPVLIFNRTMFNSRGVTDPATLWKAGNWNWDTYKSCAEQMTYTRDGLQVYGTNEADTILMASAGTSYVTVDNANGTISNNLSDPDVLNALSFCSELKNSGVVAPMGTDWQIFTQGRCAMWITGASQVKKGREFDNMTDDWSSVPIPCPKGQEVIAPYATVSFGIPKGARQGIAGSYLIRWLLDANNWDILSTFSHDGTYETWVAQQDYKVSFYAVSPILNFSSGLSDSLQRVTWGNVNDVPTGLKSLSGNLDSAINSIIHEMDGQ